MTGFTIRSKSPIKGSQEGFKLEKGPIDSNNYKCCNIKNCPVINKYMKKMQKDQKSKPVLELHSGNKDATSDTENYEMSRHIKIVVKDSPNNKIKQNKARDRHDKPKLNTGEKHTKSGTESYENCVVKNCPVYKYNKKMQQDQHDKPVLELNSGNKDESTDIEDYEKSRYVKPVVKQSPRKKMKKAKARDRHGKPKLNTGEKHTNSKMENYEYCDVKKCPVYKYNKNMQQDQHDKPVLELHSGNIDESTDMEDYEKSRYVKCVKHSPRNKIEKAKAQDRHDKLKLNTGEKYANSNCKFKNCAINKYNKKMQKDQHGKPVLELNSGKINATTDTKNYGNCDIKNCPLNKYNKKMQQIQHGKPVLELNSGKKDVTTDMEHYENCNIKECPVNKYKEKLLQNQHGKPVIKDINKSTNCQQFDVKDISGDKNVEKYTIDQSTPFEDDSKSSSELFEKAITGSEHKRKKNVIGNIDQSSACQCKNPLEQIKKLLDQYCAVKNINESNEKCMPVTKKEAQIYGTDIKQLRKPKNLRFRDFVPQSDEFVKLEDNHKLETEKRGSSVALNNDSNDSCRKSLLCKLIKFPSDKRNTVVEVKCLDNANKLSSKRNKAKSEETMTSFNKINCSLAQIDRSATVKELRDQIVGSIDAYYNQGEQCTSTPALGVEKSAQYKTLCYEVSAQGAHNMKRARHRQARRQKIFIARNTKCLYRLPVAIKRVLSYVAVVLCSPCIIIAFGLYFCLGRKQTQTINIKRRSRVTRSSVIKSLFNYYKQIFQGFTAVSLTVDTCNNSTPIWLLESRRKRHRKIGRRVVGDLCKCSLMKSYMSFYASIPQMINQSIERSTSFKRTTGVKIKRRRKRKSNSVKKYSQLNKHTRQFLAGGDASTILRKKHSFHHVVPKIKDVQKEKKKYKISSQEYCRKYLELGGTDSQIIYPIQFHNVYRCDNIIRPDARKIISFEEEESRKVRLVECRSNNRQTDKDVLTERSHKSQCPISPKNKRENLQTPSQPCTHKSLYDHRLCPVNKIDGNVKIQSQSCTQRSSCQRRLCPINKKDGNVQTPITSSINKYNSKNDNCESKSSKIQYRKCTEKEKDENLQISSQSCTQSSSCQRRLCPINKRDGNVQTPIASSTNKYYSKNDDSESESSKIQYRKCTEKEKDENLQIPSQSCTHNLFCGRRLCPGIKKNENMQISSQFCTQSSSCQRRLCPINKRDGNVQTPIASSTNKYNSRNDNSESESSKIQYRNCPGKEKDENLQIPSQPCTHSVSCQGRIGPVYKKDGNMQTPIASSTNKYNSKKDQSENVSSMTQYRTCPKNEKDENMQILSQSCNHNTSQQRHFRPLNKEDKNMQTRILFSGNNENKDNSVSILRKIQYRINLKNKKDEKLQTSKPPCTHSSSCQCRLCPAKKRNRNMQTPNLTPTNKYIPDTLLTNLTKKYSLKKALSTTTVFNHRPRIKKKLFKRLSKRPYTTRSDESCWTNSGIKIRILSANEYRSRKFCTKIPDKPRPKKYSVTDSTQTKIAFGQSAQSSFWERCKKSLNAYVAFENKCNNNRPYRCNYVKNKEIPSLWRTLLTVTASLCCLPCILYFCFRM